MVCSVVYNQLNECTNRTVSCVTAENLGAHVLAGFMESFSAECICAVDCVQLRNQMCWCF